MKQLIYNHFILEVHVQHRKSLQISLINENRLLVKVPPGLKYQDILNLVDQKREWIDDHVVKLRLKANKQAKLITHPGDQVLFLGQVYEVIKDYCSSKTGVLVDTQTMTLKIVSPYKLTADEEQALLTHWFKHQAKAIINQRVQYLASLNALNPGRITIKDQKKRWGSCSSKGNLNFNWRLIKAPPETIDSIILHELCHLTHLNHSKDFWLLLESRCPDYKRHHQWLVDYGSLLYE